MAQWSTADKVLQAKVVYYGPAFGGKTTNLKSLHRITDPEDSTRLISLQTADDRTLFFDLLPFDLGEILGYQVKLKLYTVPGQVRYDTTRKVVLGGADAVVFVADSRRGREDQNRWSLQNLRMNMRARGLEPDAVPVLYQFNKQDLDDAESPDQVARWFGIRPEQGIPAVATEGQGVVETFVAATRALLESWASRADTRTRGEIDLEELGRGLDRVFGPYLAGREGPTHADDPLHRVVLDEDDLLQSSVRATVDLGERLSGQTERASRLEKEVEALRRLGEAMQTVGASFESGAILDAALSAAGEALDAGAVSLISIKDDEPAGLDRAWPVESDVLLDFEGGRRLLAKMARSRRPCVVDDPMEACGDRGASERLLSMRSVAAVPMGSPRTRLLLAYAPQPSGSFREHDVRFLAAVAAQLAVGLEKASLYEQLARRRDQLEQLVESRTGQLRKAYEELRGLDLMKDRFLSGLSHEMKTPLTGILSSAVLLRDYETDEGQRRETAGSIVESAETLTRLLDDLFRVTGIEDASQPLSLDDVSAEALVRQAVELSGHRNVRCRISNARDALRLDAGRLSRAVANLIDNAVKFSSGRKVDLVLTTETLSVGSRTVDRLSIGVLDDAPTVGERDRLRIFDPFEQGGDPLTGKPAGIGLGLYEARTIARQHGGELEHRPREKGGNEFRLTVPIAGATRKRPALVGANTRAGGRP